MRTPLVAVGLTTVLLVALLAVRLGGRAEASEHTFSLLLANAEAVDRSVLVSQETLVGVPGTVSEGSGGGPTLGAALRLGDATVRWQVSRRSGKVSAKEQDVVAADLRGWLNRTTLRGEAADWARTLTSVEAQDPSPRALRSLQRSFPDDAVEAGRWLSLLRLWPSEDAEKLSREARTLAYGVLDAAGLLRTSDSSMPELLSKEALSAGELEELGGLATALILSTR